MMFALIVLLCCAPIAWWLSPKNTARLNKGSLIWQCGALALCIAFESWWFVPANLALIALWVRALRISRHREAMVARMVHEAIRSWDLP